MNVNSWPEQDAVEAWLEKYNIKVSNSVAMELNNAKPVSRLVQSFL